MRLNLYALVAKLVARYGLKNRWRNPYRFESGQGHFKKVIIKMSRSYKKTPRSGDKKNKFLKKYANRKYRKLPLEDTVQYKSYKKTFCSYDICDYEDVGRIFEEFYHQSVRS